MAFRLPNLQISPSLARSSFFWVRLRQGVNPLQLLNQLFKQPSTRDVMGGETRTTVLKYNYYYCYYYSDYYGALRHYGKISGRSQSSVCGILLADPDRNGVGTMG